MPLAILYRLCRVIQEYMGFRVYLLCNRNCTSNTSRSPPGPLRIRLWLYLYLGYSYRNQISYSWLAKTIRVQIPKQYAVCAKTYMCYSLNLHRGLYRGVLYGLLRVILGVFTIAPHCVLGIWAAGCFYLAVKR